MTAVKTQIGAHDTATGVDFNPPTDIPASSVWDAIVYVWGQFKASLVSLTSAQFSADVAMQTAQEARALAAKTAVQLRHQTTATVTDDQIALKAQVFN